MAITPVNLPTNWNKQKKKSHKIYTYWLPLTHISMTIYRQNDLFFCWWALKFEQHYLRNTQHITLFSNFDFLINSQQQTFVRPEGFISPWKTIHQTTIGEVLKDDAPTRSLEEEQVEGSIKTCKAVAKVKRTKIQFSLWLVEVHISWFSTMRPNGWMLEWFVNFLIRLLGNI